MDLITKDNVQNQLNMTERELRIRGLSPRTREIYLHYL